MECLGRLTVVAEGRGGEARGGKVRNPVHVAEALRKARAGHHPWTYKARADGYEVPTTAVKMR